MEYPSLSLEQDLIDRIFSGEKNPNQEDLKKIPLSQSIRMKEYDRKKKKILLENPVVEECDQCGHKTSKYRAMYRHMREKHTALKQKCTDCEYSHIYPNRVKKHYYQVHLGMKNASRKIGGVSKCRREMCQYAGTMDCPELQRHSSFLCEQCQLLFKRSDDLKFHNDKIHLGLVFSCKHCDSYSTARKSGLVRHINLKGSSTKKISIA